jgi:hypothetical protein
MFWTAAFVIAPTLFFVKTLAEYVYPDKLKILGMKAGWYTMEFCSKMEIQVTRVYKEYIEPLLPQKPQQAMVRLICDGDEIANYTFSKFLLNKDNIKVAYDFILYDIPIVKKDKYEKYDRYMLRYENINDVLSMEYNSLKCFELNMIQITINDSDNYNIDFGRDQFMVNGNVLFDRPFLKWHLNIYCGIILDKEDKYVITFIDHNMNYITLPDSCYIFVRKNNYDIVNFMTS